MKTVYLLTGKPGTGKTSLIKQAVSGFRSASGGFYTSEIRNQGVRLGFKLVTLDGQEATLAHVNFNKRFRVGKYGVDIAAMERTGVHALRQASGRDGVIIIDEIGKMELLSPAFKEIISEIIDSDKKILGTIMAQPDPWADTLKSHPNVNLVSLTRDNFSQVLADVRQWLLTVSGFLI